METVLKAQSGWTIANEDEWKLTASVPDWENREGREKALLKMLVKDCIMPHIREYKSTCEISTVLKDLYEMRNTNRLFF